MEETDSMTPEERAAFVRTAIDGWNTSIHYFDRKSKNKKMMSSPYAFYRGTDHLFWQDHGQHDRLAKFGNENTVTWLSGDAHAYNAGSFYSDQHDAVVFGLNDFDESVVADYQLDLWRLAVSFVLIGRENENLSNEEAVQVVDALSKSYLTRMRKLANGQATIEPFTKENTGGKLDDFLEIIEKISSRGKMLDKWAPVDGSISSGCSRSFDLTNEKLGSATHLEKETICQALGDHYWKTLPDPASVNPTNTKILDVARRLLAGTGSLGMDRYYVLIQDANDIIRILDVKEQSRPCPLPFMGATAQAVYDGHAAIEKEGKSIRNCAKAVVTAARCRSTQTSQDPYTGWLEMNGVFYSVQERSPWKGSFPALLPEAKGKFKKLALDSLKRYEKLAEQMATVFATHHASAQRFLGCEKSLEHSIVDLVGEQGEAFAELVRTVAFEYADQVKADFEAFKDGLGADMKTESSSP